MMEILCLIDDNSEHQTTLAFRPVNKKVNNKQQRPKVLNRNVINRHSRDSQHAFVFSV